MRAKLVQSGLRLWQAEHSRLGMVFVRLLLLTFLCLSASAQQQHATFQYGDILAGGQTPSTIGFALGRFDWFLPDGELNFRIASTFNELPQDVILDRARRAYWPTGFTTRVFDNTGTFVENFPGFPGEFLRITFDRAGNVYLGGAAATANLIKVSSTGDLIATFTVPYDGLNGGLLFGLDLASDQCTVCYTAAGRRVFRFDACRGMPLPDLNSNLPGIEAWTLRILPDGGVLVSNLESVLRLSNTGDIVTVYDIAGEHDWRGLALDVDHTSFWATSQNTAYKFDIESGASLDSFQSSDYLFNAITVVGEPRAAVAGTDIPTLSEWGLITFALGLAAVAVIRIGTINA